MDKHDMRVWVSSLEEIIDNKLPKWRKIPKVENGEAVQLAWQWEQSRIMLNIFWEDHKETLNLVYLSPRMDYQYRYHRLDDLTFNRVNERIGNLAMLTLHPPIEPPPPID